MTVTAELRLLGPPSLTIDGQIVRLHSSKAYALLAYLVLEGGKHHSREKLAELLWGESGDAHAKQSLRQALYSIRQALSTLADYCLSTEEEAVTFKPHADLWIDVLEFLDVADGRELEFEALYRAAQLASGPLLEGLKLSDCPSFEEWLFLRRERLEQQTIRLLQTLTDRLIRLGNYDKALPYAHQIVALDSLNEGSYRRLMTIYAGLGDLDAVRRQYRLCGDVLERELGVEPAAESKRLYQQLIAARPVAEAISVPLLPVQGAGKPLFLAFVERERELVELNARLTRARSGKGGLVFIAGEAGIGKTRLVVEWMRRIQATNAGPSAIRWLMGRCYELEINAPFAIWADILHSLVTPDWQLPLAGLAQSWREQVARIVPELAQTTSDLDGTTDSERRLRLFQGIVQCLLHLARPYPLVLFFDDLQWADSVSIELLHYVARHLTEHPLLIIGTYRPEGLADNPPLSQLLTQSANSLTVSTIRLLALSQPGVEHCLSHLEIEIPAQLLQPFYAQSEGNPFVLTETLRIWAETSADVDRSVDAIVDEGRPLPLPLPVRELVLGRLSKLREEQRRALAAAAVIAHPFDIALLRRVTGGNELQLLGVAEQLLNRAFLRETMDHTGKQFLEYQHDYVRSIIYSAMSAVQRTALHRRVAEALRSFYRSRPQRVAEEVAYHYEQAADPKAVQYLGEAAQQAEMVFAYSQAAALYTRALNAHTQYAAHDLVTHFALLLCREKMLDRQGRRAEQEQDVRALVQIADSIGDASRIASAHLRRAGYLTHSGRFNEAQRAGEQALAMCRAAGDYNGEAQALRELGFLYWTTENYTAAIYYTRAGLNLHRQMGNVAGEATALHNLAEIYRGLGSPRQALEFYEQALTLFWSQQDQQQQVLALFGIAHALRQSGDATRSFSRYEQALALCETTGNRLMASRVHQALANSHWENLSREQAIFNVQAALSISRDIGYGPGIAHGLITLSYFHIQMGDIDTAYNIIQEATDWLKLDEDERGLNEVQNWLSALRSDRIEAMQAPAAMGWIKSYVIMPEGKVYCEFDSPIARQHHSFSESP